MVATPPSAPGLRVGGPLVALQGVLGLAYTIFVIIETIRFGATGPADVSSNEGSAIQIVIFVLVSLGLLWSAWGLWREQRWSRAPVVLIEIILLIVGFQQATNAHVPGGIRLAFAVISLTALITLVCVFLPSSTARFNAASGE